MLNLVMQILAHAAVNAKLREAFKVVKRIHSQLVYMEYFVENLLNVKMIKSGVFNIQLSPFDPQSAIQFVLDVFELSAKEQRVSLEAETVSFLTMPDVEPWEPRPRPRITQSDSRLILIDTSSQQQRPRADFATQLP